MSDQFDWNDLKIFAAVLRSGSFSAAARNLGASQPTIGRRVRVLEEHFGEALLRRTTDGCIPTERGRLLLPLIERMQHTAARIQQQTQMADTEVAGVVRIASNGWMGHLFANRWLELCASSPKLELELVIDFRYANLDRGDAEIAVRNRRPPRGQLVARKLGTAVYAIYGAESYVNANSAARGEERYRECDWISFDKANSDLPVAKWLSARLEGRRPKIRCNHSELVIEAAAAGAGLTILPAFIGDEHPNLVRASELLEPIDLDIWLVTHRESRRIARVKHVAERIVQIFASLDSVR